MSYPSPGVFPTCPVAGIRQSALFVLLNLWVLEGYFAARGRAYQEQYCAESNKQGVEQSVEQRLAAEWDCCVGEQHGSEDFLTADRPADLLADVASSDDLAPVGELIIDCTTGE